MGSLKKVSIIIPFYNRIPLVLESIQSALGQTHKEIEIILVDDGSTDDISQVIEIAKSDNRIRFLTGNHAGVSAARNLALKHATGEFIAFLDSDDLFEPDKIRIQLDFMLKNNYSISHTSYEKIDMQGKPLGVMHSGKFSGRVYPQIISGCCIAAPTIMARAEVFCCKDEFFRHELRIGRMYVCGLIWHLSMSSAV